MLNMEDSNTCKTCEKELGSNARACDTCLEYLNVLRHGAAVDTDVLKYIFLPMVKASKEANQSGAVLNVNRLLEVRNFTLDEIFIMQKRWEAAAGEIAAIYLSLKIKARIPDPKKLEAKTQEFAEAVKDQKIAQLPKKERKQLDDYDKAVQALVKNGLPEDMAKQIIQGRMKEQGKLTEVK